MIRDPSDGTVKEISPEANKINAVAAKQAPKEIGPDTGLRQPTRTDAQLRLERSREFVRDYHAKKERENARGSNDEKRSTDGDSSEQARQAEPALRGSGGPNSREDRQG
jgi:hypothetical protein